MKTNIPNIKVDDQRVEQILRAIVRYLDNFSTSNDIEITENGKGLILKDELGIRWRVMIDSTGSLVQARV